MHEALFYDDDEGGAAAIAGFALGGLEAGEPVLLALPGARLDLVRDALGATAGSPDLHWTDLAEAGRNPGRIIAVWQTFVAEATAAGRQPRGVGEPAWPGRSPHELAECHRHETLLNVAFGEGPSWRLLCPYDARRLDPSVLAMARTTHAEIDDPAHWHAAAHRQLEDALPPGPRPRFEAELTAQALAGLRSIVRHHALDSGVSPARAEDLVLAVNELATNSVSYAGGGRLRLWQEATSLVCEVEDRGRLHDPLVGRLRPPLDQRDGRGLWLVHQLCDLVQLRSSPAGTVARIWLHTS